MPKEAMKAINLDRETEHPRGIKGRSTGQLSMDQFIKNTDKKFKTSL